MPVSDQVRPVESAKPAAASGFHAELHSIWGPPPAIKQAGEFLAGVGEGFGQAVNEGAKAAIQAVSNPGEAIHHAVSETTKTVTGVLSATEAAGEYIGDHAARGDMKGVVHDAQNTSHAIEHVLSAGIEHLSNMNAHDLGKVVGHDVLPGAIVAVAAPELEGEGIALAASAASKIGTVVREGAVIEKVAGVYESAASKISAISEKMAGLNQKMEELAQRPKVYASSDIETIHAPRLRDGIIARGEAVSEKFAGEVESARKSLNGLESKWLETTKLTKVHNMAEEEGRKHAFSMGVWKLDKFYENPGEIKIAQVTGFKTDLIPNRDVRHSLVHEIGHMISDKFNGLNGPLSDTKEFLDVLKNDVKEVNSTVAREARETLKQLYPDGGMRRHEIWAESFALASDDELGIKSTSRLGRLVKDGYPSAVEHLKNFREANKTL
jgi:hypothetical protein